VRAWNGVPSSPPHPPPPPFHPPPRSEYGLFKVLRAHILPLTNCAFNKAGDRFITGSYDRTCKVRALEGAAGVLRFQSLLIEFAASYALPFPHPPPRLEILPQVWDTVAGQELLSLEGHKNVVYAIAFNNPYGDKVRGTAAFLPSSPPTLSHAPQSSSLPPRHPHPLCRS
jgi:WD40 repeat protein